jgi:hypothetical protein
MSLPDLDFAGVQTGPHRQADLTRSAAQRVSRRRRHLS